MKRWKKIVLWVVPLLSVVGGVIWWKTATTPPADSDQEMTDAMKALEKSAHDTGSDLNVFEGDVVQISMNAYEYYQSLPAGLSDRDKTEKLIADKDKWLVERLQKGNTYSISAPQAADDICLLTVETSVRGIRDTLEIPVKKTGVIRRKDIWKN